MCTARHAPPLVCGGSGGRVAVALPHARKRPLRTPLCLAFVREGEHRRLRPAPQDRAQPYAGNEHHIRLCVLLVGGCVEGTLLTYTADRSGHTLPRLVSR